MIWPFKKATTYPDPAVGQVWECGHNGTRMLVGRIEISNTGFCTIYVHERAVDDRSKWGMSHEYAAGLNRKEAVKDFHRQLRLERRTLVEDKTP